MPWRMFAFAAGVWLLQQSAVLPAPSVIGGLAAGALMLGWLSRRQTTVLAVIAAGLLGFAWAGGWAHWRMADSLPGEWEGRDMEVTGMIAELPQHFERGVRFTFVVEEANAPVPGRIALSWYRHFDSDPEDESGEEVAPSGSTPVPRAGERWRFNVRLKNPHGSVNPHGFDYEAWLFERGIRATGYVKKSVPAGRQNIRLDSEADGLTGFVGRWREQIRARMMRTLPGQPYAGILSALAVGDQQAIAPEMWRLFAVTGITHLMSISGLHVTMLGGLVAWLVAVLWRRSPRLPLLWPTQKAAALAGLAGAFIYALLAGFGVPAQRTLYMLGVVVAALLSGRALAASNVLGAALLLVVLLDPWAVLSAGFWLSFGAVAVLFFITQRSTAGRHWLVEWLRAQWALTLALVPLLLALFQQFSLVSPLANAIAIPLVSLVVTPLALLGAVPGFSWCLSLAHALLSPLMDLLAWLSALPGALWQQHAPPDWAVVVAAGGVVWLLLPRGFPARWLGLLAMLPLFVIHPVRPAPGEAMVRILDVGQGQAIHVQTATRDLLVDTGPDFSGNADAGSRILVPYFRAIGVVGLDRMIVSHADRDHAGGMESVLASVPVADLQTSMQKSALAGRRCIDGERWEWDGVRFLMLHPTPGDYARKLPTNAMSCVLKVETTSGSVLIPGDLEGPAEAAFLGRHAATVQAGVLVAPHHGGRRTSTPGFVAAIGAHDVIFSAGYRNRFGHPDPAVETRYRESGAVIHRTDRDGAVTLVMGRDGIRTIHEREVRRRYWHNADT